MEININQKKISINNEYKIFINGQQTYSASAKLFRLFDEIYLFKLEDNRLKYKIKKKWSFFSVAYDLISQNNNVFEFRTKQFWKGHYCCQVKQDIYDIFAHKDRKYSIFKNDTQIAWWDKQTISWFNEDNYKIIVDNGSNYELIILFCLIIDNAFYKNNSHTTLTIDLGNVLQAKEFNSTWQPK